VRVVRVVLAVLLVTAPLIGKKSLAGDAAITAQGAIQTVDSSGATRLWGKGRNSVTVYLSDGPMGPALCRNGNVGFGLSNATAEWDSADHACPLGTWVCTEAERGTAACYTFRPDGAYQGRWCTGEEASGNWGWLADASIDSPGLARLMNEAGFVFSHEPCNSVPVWCCSEWP